MAKQLTLPAALLLLAASSGPAAPSQAAQDPVRVSSDVVCAECVITIDTVLTLGGLDGEGMEAIDITSSIVVDARERILITSIFHQKIYVFDMAGRFLRTVGRQGEGPGEYFRISHINAGPQYIHVFEAHRGRTLLDHDFQFVRRDRFPGQVTQSFVTDSEVVAFAAWVPTPAAAGHKLHLLAPSGEMESYGGDDSVRRTQVRFGGVVTGDGASLWIKEYESTRVTRWDLLPKPTIARIWDRTVDEWDRHDRGPNIFPTPFNNGAMLDESGLWIVWNAPDPGWGGISLQGAERFPIPCRTSTTAGWSCWTPPRERHWRATSTRVSGRVSCWDHATWSPTMRRTRASPTSTSWNRACPGVRPGRANGAARPHPIGIHDPLRPRGGQRLFVA